MYLVFDETIGVLSKCFLVDNFCLESDCMLIGVSGLFYLEL